MPLVCAHHLNAIRMKCLDDNSSQIIPVHSFAYLNTLTSSNYYIIIATSFDHPYMIRWQMLRISRMLFFEKGGLYICPSSCLLVLELDYRRDTRKAVEQSSVSLSRSSSVAFTIAFCITTMWSTCISTHRVRWSCRTRESLPVLTTGGSAAMAVGIPASQLLCTIVCQAVAGSSSGCKDCGVNAFHP